MDATDVRSQFSLFGSRFAGLLLATDLMRHVGEMSDVTSAQVRQSRAEYGKAASALEPFKRILDIYASQSFANGTATKKRKAATQPAAVKFLKSSEAETVVNARGDKELRQALGQLSEQDKGVAESALQAAQEKHFFHWELEFPEVFYGPRPGSRTEIERLEGGGFDAVIGNPPYIRIQSLTDADAEFFTARYTSATGKFDIYLPFIEIGFNHLKPTGREGFIVPNKFLTADYGVGIRRFLSQQVALRRIVDFRDTQVFPGISTYACLLFLSKSAEETAEVIWAEPSAIPDDSALTISKEEIDEKPWAFSASKLTVYSKHMPLLGQVCEAIFQGLITGADTLLIGHRQGGTAVFDGQEILLEEGLVKPLLRGKDVRRYGLADSGACVIYPYRHSAQGDELIPEEDLAEQFPATYSYLLNRKNALANRGSESMEYESWYALWCPRKRSRFESKKIVTQVLASRAAFAFDDGLFCFVGGGNAGVYGIIPREDLEVDIWYLLGLLNSETFDKMLQSVSSRFRGGYYSYARRFIERIPIRVSNFSASERDMAERISSLARHRSSPKTDVDVYEIDREVAELTEALYEGISPEV